MGVHQLYDHHANHHQVPGFLFPRLRSLLADAGLPGLLDRGVGRDRARARGARLSPMVVPFADFVCHQAIANVSHGTRYAVVPDGIARYARGDYGRPAAPIDETVLSRIDAAASRQPPAEPSPPQLDELRKTHGPLSDDDLLIAAMFGPEELHALQESRQAHGRARREPVSPIPLSPN